MNIGVHLSLFERITNEVCSGLKLKTPVQRCPFVVDSVEPDKVVFFARKTHIEVSKGCWDGLLDFLKDGRWVLIGGKHEVTANIDIGTLEKYLRNCTISKTKHSQARYVASLLEYLGIIEVDHYPPSKVRLITNKV